MMNVFAAALGALTDAVEGVCDPLNEPAQCVPMVDSREEADDPVTLFHSINDIDDEGELFGWKQNAETDFVESDAMLVAVANLTSRSHYIAVAQFLSAPHHQAPLTALSFPAQQSQARQRFHNAAMYDRLLDIFLILNGSHRCTVRKTGGNLLQEEGASSGTISDEVVAALRFLHPAAAWDALPSVAAGNRSKTAKKAAGGGSVAPLSLLLPLAKSALQYPKGLPLEALASVSPSAQKHRAETVAALLYSSGPRLPGATVHSATAACCVAPLMSSLPTTTTTESMVLAEHEQRVLELSTCAPLSTLLSQCQWDVLWQRLRQSGPTASTKHSRIPPLERVHFSEGGGGETLIAPGLYLLLVKSEDQNVVGSVFVAHSSTTAVSGETSSQANNTTGTTSAPPPPWALLFTFTPTLNGIAGISSHSDDAQLQYASRVQLTRDDERHTKRISLAVKVGVRSQYIELHALELRIGVSSAQCRLVNQIRRYAQPAAESLTAATSENRNSFQPAAAATASFHFSVPTIDDVFVVDRWELFRFPDDCSTPHTTGPELLVNVQSPERLVNELPIRPTFLDGTLAAPRPVPVAPPNERTTSEEQSDDEYEEARNLTHQADSLPQHKAAAMPDSDFGSWEDLGFALDAESNADGPYPTTVDADTHASLYVARALLRQNTPPSLFEHPPKLAASLPGPARRKGSSTRSNGSSSNGSGFVVV